MLVICNSIPSSKNVLSTDFRVGEVYRHIPDGKYHFVNRYKFPKVLFDKHFTKLSVIFPVYIEQIGLVKNGKFVSKRKFKEISHIEVYGYGKTKKLIVFIGKFRENLFKLYPYTTNQSDALNWAYNVMSEIYNGDVNAVDSGNVKWTNKGIPIVYDYTSPIYTYI